MNGMGDYKTEWFRKFYKWLTYLVVASFIVIGSGILLKVLLPDPYPITPTQRWVMGGVILAYGIARIISLYVKSKKERNSEATFK